MDGQATRKRTETRVLTRAEARPFHGERGRSRRSLERAQAAKAREGTHPTRGEVKPTWSRVPPTRGEGRRESTGTGREGLKLTREVRGRLGQPRTGERARDLKAATRGLGRRARKRAREGHRRETRGSASGREAKGPQEWKEQVVRVGTGYRVRKDERNPRKRRFDVGYADRKAYTRKDGREVTVETSNMGRTVSGKGDQARVKVMNAVSAREKRRPASEYTGSGIRRKSKVGKRKLKPTKAQTKA